MPVVRGSATAQTHKTVQLVKLCICCFIFWRTGIQSFLRSVHNKISKQIAALLGDDDLD